MLCNLVLWWKKTIMYSNQCLSSFHISPVYNSLDENIGGIWTIAYFYLFTNEWKGKSVKYLISWQQATF